MTARVRTAIRVEGVVQGVGFRPFVYGLATSLGLAGFVGNDVDGVFAEIEGEQEAVAKFLLLLEQQAPPLAQIDRVSTTSLAAQGSAGFTIAPSEPAGQRHAPEPVRLRHPVPRPVLACGAELKSTFCLAQDDRAFLSQHIGDLENAETLQSFTSGIAHFRQLFDIQPQLVAHDLHPDYLSTKYALELDGVELVGVQHQHAHIAACLADNDEDGPVIGVAFDGTGYGPDGTIWGGEFLIADLAGFRRAGYLEPVPMPGGVAAIRQPWRMAAVYLEAGYAGDVPSGLGVLHRNAQVWGPVTTMAARGINAPRTSSAGRLFDAAAALLGVRDTIHYEGQAAIELEQLADPHEGAGYPATLSWTSAGDELQVRGADLIRAAADDLAGGTDRATVAARFHYGVADAIVATCHALRERHGHQTVALSGGVFQNVLLTTAVVHQLRHAGFTVLTHSRVPCNDGGISLGQAVVAGARDRLGLL